jgi:predicted dehydrogenase
MLGHTTAGHTVSSSDNTVETKTACVSVGVIGTGYWGPKLARNFHELAGARLDWVCDLRPQRLEHIQYLYPEVRTTQAFEQVLASDVDAVCITTPVRTHHKLALQALRAGKHVLVEKPLAMSSQEAEEIIAVAEEQQRVVMVGHTFLYNPAVLAMKDIIGSGMLGEIYYVNATRVNLGLFQPDINVAWDLAPHDISILLYVLGMRPVAASARGRACVQRQKMIHDVAHLTLDFPNGLFADVRLSWLDPHKIRRYTVVGSERMLEYDDVEPENKIMIFDKGVTIPPYSDTEADFRLSYRTGEGVPYPIQWEEPLKVECQHFLDSITHGTEPRSGGRNGLEVVKVLEAAQVSLLNGGGREVLTW